MATHGHAAPEYVVIGIPVNNEATFGIVQKVVRVAVAMTVSAASLLRRVGARAHPRPGHVYRARADACHRTHPARYRCTVPHTTAHHLPLCGHCLRAGEGGGGVFLRANPDWVHTSHLALCALSPCVALQVFVIVQNIVILLLDNDPANLCAWGGPVAEPAAPLSLPDVLTEPDVRMVCACGTRQTTRCSTRC